MNEDVGGAVDAGQALLRHAAEQPHPIGEAELAGQRLDARPFGPVAGNREIDPRQMSECFDDQRVPLQRDQIADRKQGRTREAERAPRRLSVGRRAKHGRSTPLRNTRTRSARRPERDQSPLQAGRHRDKPGGVSGRPSDPSPRNGIGRDQIEIGPARRDNDGAVQRPAQQNRGDPVRVEIMRVDQVEILAVADLPPQSAAEPRRTSPAAPNSFRSLAATDNADARFRSRDGSRSRRARKSRIRAEFRRRQREPGAWRDNPGGHAPLSTSLRSRVSTKIPCVGRAALGYNVVNVRIRKV